MSDTASNFQEMRDPYELADAGLQVYVDQLRLARIEVGAKKTDVWKAERALKYAEGRVTNWQNMIRDALGLEPT